MTIKSIVEIENKTFPNQAPVKEKMDIYVPKITAENKKGKERKGKGRKGKEKIP